MQTFALYIKFPLYSIILVHVCIFLMPLFSSSLPSQTIHFPEEDISRGRGGVRRGGDYLLLRCFSSDEPLQLTNTSRLADGRGEQG